VPTPGAPAAGAPVQAGVACPAASCEPGPGWVSTGVDAGGLGPRACARGRARSARRGGAPAPRRAPPGVARGGRGAPDAPRRAAPTRPSAGGLGVCGRSCPRHGAGRGRGVVGGGRPAAGRWARASLARPPSARARAVGWRGAADARPSLAPSRPAVRGARAFPRAWAAAGLLVSRSRRWAPPLGAARPREGDGRGRRAPGPGFAAVGRCGPPGCWAVQTGHASRVPAPAPGSFCLQRVRRWRWLPLPLAPPHLRWRCPERPARRDIRIEAAKVRRFSPLQTGEDQSPTWGRRGHACPGREGRPPAWKLRYEVKGFIFHARSTRKPQLPFNQRVAL
jgi:hypothetical protein